jgi:NOL1/NOP2/fmu family ribosome biogenesis protein
LAGEDERHLLISYVEDRFGIPRSAFRDYLFFRRKKSWVILRRSPFINKAHRLKVSGVGMKVFNRVGRYIKPTTRFIQIFGPMATRGSIDINEKEFENMVAGKAFTSALMLKNGYIIISHRGSILGLGLLIDGKIHSQIPKQILCNQL